MASARKDMSGIYAFMGTPCATDVAATPNTITIHYVHCLLLCASSAWLRLYGPLTWPMHHTTTLLCKAKLSVHLSLPLLTCTLMSPAASPELCSAILETSVPSSLFAMAELISGGVSWVLRLPSTRRHARHARRARFPPLGNKSTKTKQLRLLISPWVARSTKLQSTGVAKSAKRCCISSSPRARLCACDLGHRPGLGLCSHCGPQACGGQSGRTNHSTEACAALHRLSSMAPTLGPETGTAQHDQ